MPPDDAPARCPLPAGKSTLLNSILGQEILPVNNVPETARICKLRHLAPSQCREPYLVEGEATTSGEPAAPPGVRLLAAGGAQLQAAARHARWAHAWQSVSLRGGATPPSPPPALLAPRLAGTSRCARIDSSSACRRAGAAAIRARLQQLNQSVRSRDRQLADEQLLQIYCPFSALAAEEGAAGAGEAGSAPRVFFLVTPGPHEAGEEGL